MNSSKSSIIIKSLKELRLFPENSLFSAKNSHRNATPDQNEAPLNPEEEQAILLKKAMADVTPISRDNCRETNTEINIHNLPQHDPDAEILLQLSNLVNNGKGFVVADTPEYIEGTGYAVNPKIPKRLHRGDFAIEDYIDLHGLTAEEAKEVFDQFLKEAIRTGKKAVLIVHGRGLCSPTEPVLKTKVVEWITRGPWRKWVAAFSSARACDGGTGATYLLLRKRSLTKRFKKTSAYQPH
ncbi:MAG: Smr/MutS family protein [Proteobacteria bacterium]|nr:Smr/MutS family protein [Pseudomonadota bacterium]